MAKSERPQQAKKANVGQPDILFEAVERDPDELRETEIIAAILRQVVFEPEPMKIWPDMALVLLRQMYGNRRLLMSHAKKLASLVSAGVFGASWDFLLFDTRGRPRTAQHRLVGCVLSGKPIVLMVARNVPDHIFSNSDLGTRWKPHDIYQFETRVTAICNVIFQIGCMDSNAFESTDPAIDYIYGRFRSEIDYVLTLKGKSYIWRASVQTGVVLSLADKDRDQDVTKGWVDGYLTRASDQTTTLCFDLLDDLQEAAHKSKGSPIRGAGEVKNSCPRMWIGLNPLRQHWVNCTKVRINRSLVEMKKFILRRAPKLMDYQQPKETKDVRTVGQFIQAFDVPNIARKPGRPKLDRQ